MLSRLHPELAKWFARRFPAPSPAQEAAVPHILEGRNVLVSAPTGSGKTLAAFLGILDHLLRAREENDKFKGVVALYVSPLRALTYDIRKNLAEPLAELGWDWALVGSRTGDTTPKERANQKKRPPHLLLTTPESLTLLLSQSAWGPALKNVRYVIVDELHALAENKRGALLVASLERLEDLCRRPLVRIGLSATVAPLERMAEYLGGVGRKVEVVQVAASKQIEVELFSPLRGDPYPPAGWTALRVVAELAEYIRQRETTLIFTNTRSGAETIGLKLKQLWPSAADQIEVHHASLDRAIRLEVEDRLKRGELRAVVCSTSLELGIDIGAIDLVVMISAPKGVSRALQRVGRSGHSLTETSHGILVASNVNDLVECTATSLLMRRGILERIRPQDNPLDVLAQQLVGIAIDGTHTTDEAFALLKRADPFKTLDRQTFDRVLRYLQGGGTSLERNYTGLFGKVIIVDGLLTVPRPKVARDYWQNVGTISSDAMVQVRLGRRNLGQVEETFMRRLRTGDVFVLNGRCLRFVELSLLTAKVKAADSALPTVPRWNANKMPLTSNVAAEVSRLRTEVERRMEAGDASVTQWLRSEYGISEANAEAIARHFRLQASISRVPVEGTFLIETYRDRDGLHTFFHSLIGRSANDALSRIAAFRLSKLVGGNALATIDDYGFLLSQSTATPPGEEVWRTVFRPENAEADLKSALADANLVKWHFRNAAQTGLMVPRKLGGSERKPRALQFSSEVIFDVLRRHEPDHPMLEEAYAEAMHRYLDVDRACEFLERVASFSWDLRTLTRVSPFSFGMYVSKIKETMTLEDPQTTIERLFHEMYGSKQS